MQVVRDHQLGLQSTWDEASQNDAFSNGASSPEQEPFTTWKFRSDGQSKRAIDFIWCAQYSCALAHCEQLQYDNISISN